MNESSKQIFPPHIEFYVESIRFNLSSAIRSVDELNAALLQIQENGEFDNIEYDLKKRILDSLQNIVLQAGSISKYFWPIRKKHHWRGEHLREMFKISEQSILEKRDLRDAMEHFDERLDLYLEKFCVGIFIPEYVGTFISDAPYGHVFRAYFINTRQFHLLGENYDIQPIVDEIFEVNEKLTNRVR